jgi:opacity protein-like surface antigen
MKKIFFALCLCLLTTHLIANELKDTHESKFYTVVKALNIVGNDVTHGAALLQGDNGYGFGVDIGYRITAGFSLEYDFSYSKNNVTEIEAEELPMSYSARYMTHALDLVYGHEIVNNLELFVKVGYEFEEEKIDDLFINKWSDGAVFGAGCEYELNEDYRLVGEYEHSRIDGPRGDSIYFGIMLNF